MFFVVPTARYADIAIQRTNASEKIDEVAVGAVGGLGLPVYRVPAVGRPDLPID